MSGASGVASHGQRRASTSSVTWPGTLGSNLDISDTITTLFRVTRRNYSNSTRDKSSFHVNITLNYILCAIVGRWHHFRHSALPSGGHLPRDNNPPPPTPLQAKERIASLPPRSRLTPKHYSSTTPLIHPPNPKIDQNSRPPYLRAQSLASQNRGNAGYASKMRPKTGLMPRHGGHLALAPSRHMSRVCSTG